MKKFSLLPLIALVVLAGCIGQNGDGPRGGSATGVIIKSFKADISEVYSGDPVMFTATIENVGGADAVGEAGSSTPSPIGLTLFGLGTDWNTGTNCNQPFNTNGIVDADAPYTMTKSQPQYEIPGEIYDKTFEVCSPENLAVDNTYTAVLRLDYGYTTSASGQLKVYDYTYLQSIPDEAESIMKSSALQSFDATDAPIQISLTGVARPLVKRTGTAGETQMASVVIQLSNIGQGYPYLPESYGGTGIGKRQVKVTNVDIANGECQTTDGTGLDGDIKIIPRTGKTSFACKFQLPPVADFQTIPIRIDVEYNYYVDDSTTISVLQQLV